MLGYVHAAESFSAQLVTREDLSRRTLEAVMNAHRAHHPEFLGEYVADKEGHSLLHQFLNGEFAETHVNYADRDYFAELLRSKRTVVSQAAIGRVSHMLSVQIVAPMLDKQRGLVGFTCSSVDLGAITNQAKQSVRGMSNGRVVIIDSAGQIIADSSGAKGANPPTVTHLRIFATVTGEGSNIRVGNDELGRAVRGAAVGLKSPISGWRAIAISPKATIDANARRMMLQTGTVGLLLIFVTLGLAAWVAAWISRPLRALASTAQAATHGELASMPPLLRGVPQEMAQLTLSVRSMITSLRDYTRDLESEVAARTESLSVTNRELTAAVATIQQNEQRIVEDIAKARLFQEKMLPQVPVRPDLEISISYTPLQQVSGDIFDVVEIQEQHLRIFVADAVGHGVQASMRTILLKSAYDRIKFRQPSPEAVLGALNDFLVQQFPDGDLHCSASCVDIRLGPGRAELVYANAANGPIFVFAPGQPARELYAAGPLLGVDRIEPLVCTQSYLNSGQLLLIPTDGLIEQANEQRERFEGALSKFAVEPADTAESFRARLMANFERFRGAQPVGDDVTFIVVRLRRPT